MKLYHGTSEEFEIPNIVMCKPMTDFGKGFYLSSEIKLAKDWKKFSPNHHVLIFDIVLSDINTCKLRIKRFNKADKEWAKFIYNNRRGKCKSNRYDLVIGPIADNGIEVLFQDLEHGNKTNEEWENLAKKLSLRKFSSIQYCFKTDMALKLLKYETKS